MTHPQCTEARTESQQRNVCIRRVSKVTPRPHGKLLQGRSPGHVRIAGLPRLRRLNRTSVPLLRSSARASSVSLDCQDSEGSTAPLFQAMAAQPAHLAQRLQELNSNSIPHVISGALPSRLETKGSSLRWR